MNSIKNRSVPRYHNLSVHKRGAATKERWNWVMPRAKEWNSTQAIMVYNYHSSEGNPLRIWSSLSLLLRDVKPQESILTTSKFQQSPQEGSERFSPSHHDPKWHAVNSQGNCQACGKWNREVPAFSPCPFAFPLSPSTKTCFDAFCNPSGSLHPGIWSNHHTIHLPFGGHSNHQCLL